MNTQDLSETQTVTRARALAILKEHDASLDEFAAEFGNAPTYKALALFWWLGY